MPQFSSAGVGNVSQVWAPVMSMATVDVGTNAATTLVADGHYTIIANVPFWWIYGATATKEGATSGLWPAGIPLFLIVGATVSFAQIADSASGHMTIYRNY